MASQQKVIVLQHIACEHPGIFREFMKDRGITWDAVELDEGEKIPDISGYDAMISMGGPMDVWQEDLFPWLVDEKEAIHDAVRVRNMPFLGVCLGHQLLAEAVGGAVGPAQTSEVGMLNVDMTEKGKEHALTRNLPGSIKTLQWHGAEVTGLPDDAEVLMNSPVCDVQAFGIGETSLGIQFHVETGPQTIDEWNAVPEYEKALTATFGPDGADNLREEAIRYQSNLSSSAKIIFENWLGTWTD